MPGQGVAGPAKVDPMLRSGTLESLGTTAVMSPVHGKNAEAPPASPAHSSKSSASAYSDGSYWKTPVCILACHQFIIVAYASFLMLHLLVHVEAEALLYAEQEGAIEMLGGGNGNVQGSPGPNLVLQLSGSCGHMRT